MNDLRDFVAFAQFGNLGVLILGIGLLGILIHTKPVRQAVAVAVSLLGGLLMWEGASLFHGETQSSRTSIAVVLIIAALALAVGRSMLARSVGGR